MFPAQLPQNGSDELTRRREPAPSLAGDHNSQYESSGADAAVAQMAHDALWKEPTIRAMDYDNIDIRVRNGTVGLYGHAISGTNRQLAERAIRGVSGTAGIENHLIADDRLLAEVAGALGALEHTYKCKFFTGVFHGVVMLSGTVDEPGTRLLAEQCAASIPGVRGVIDSIRLRGGGPMQEDVPFVQPYIGSEFFFLDGISGRVQQVIIDPDNRRVVAIELKGRFADQQQDLKSLNNGSSRLPERTLVVPVAAIRYLTRSSGFLNVNYGESDQYAEFNASDYLVPATDWNPPYPYHPGDVLLCVRQAAPAEQIPQHVESAAVLAAPNQVLKDQMLENDSPGG